MERFHQATPENKVDIARTFDDARLRYLGERLIFEEWPMALPFDVHTRLETELRARHRAVMKCPWLFVAGDICIDRCGAHPCVTEPPLNNVERQSGLERADGKPVAEAARARGSAGDPCLSHHGCHQPPSANPAPRPQASVGATVIALGGDQREMLLERLHEFGRNGHLAHDMASAFQRSDSNNAALDLK